jgi:PDZ domain-containing protein
MKLRRLAKALATALGVLFVALAGLSVYSLLTYSNSYLLMPDKPHALAPLVKVPDRQKDDAGSLYFVDVIEQRATLAERYLPFLRRDGTLVSPQQLGPANISDKQRARLDVAAMVLSQKIAKTVALRALGYKVVVHARVLVQQTSPGSNAAKKLRPGDVITAVGGEPVTGYPELRALVTRHRPGELIRISFERGGRERTATLRTFASPSKPHVTLIGVAIAQEVVSIKLPIKVTINAGNVGGPSAGLAFALELTDKLGRDVDRGYRVAATGELFLNGSVGAIGGVKQKVIGARRAGIQIMLVPAGDNANEAKRYAGTMKIIPVTSFQQALHTLATAERKH